MTPTPEEVEALVAASKEAFPLDGYGYHIPYKDAVLIVKGLADALTASTSQPVGGEGYRAFKLAGPLDVRTGDGMWAVDAVGPPARPVARCLGQADAERIAALLSSPSPRLAEAGWRPIDEAPRDGSAILLWDCKATRSAVGFWTHPRSSRTPGYWATRPGNWQLQPTHWQPLPEPPAP